MIRQMAGKEINSQGDNHPVKFPAIYQPPSNGNIFYVASRLPDSVVIRAKSTVIILYIGKCVRSVRNFTTKCVVVVVVVFRT